MIGRILGRYRVLSMLGKGGMGEVYRAVDTRLDRLVAIKLLPEEYAKDAKRLRGFEKEAKTIAALNHPNIVTIYSIEQSEDVRFITMEIVEGQTLSRMIPPRGMPLQQLLELGARLADAVSAAHERNVIHRDLKPANIMVSDDGRLKVLDFGLATLRARSTESQGSQIATTETDTGHIVGTVLYMSPEQRSGSTIDHRSDIYSMGIVLYQMATGKIPSMGATTPPIATSMPRAISAEAGGHEEIRRQLGRIVDHCLKGEPGRRFQTALDVRNELENLLEELDSGASSPAQPPRPVRADSRRSIAVIPLVNLSPDPQTDYLSDGITDELISYLGQLEGLHTVSRTSVFKFKGQAEDVRVIGAKLGVDTVLEGSARQLGRRIRINVQLTNVADGYQLWSARYDRKMKDLFQIQDEIAQSIVHRLEVRLSDAGSPRGIRRSTRNLDAYHLYLKGRYFWNQQTLEGFQQAMRFFEEALEQDPNYALAYTGIADYYGMLGFWGFARPDDVWPKARAAASKAMEIDDMLAEAHNSVGWVRLFYDWDSEGTEHAFGRAIDLNPGNPNAHYAYSLYLCQQGRLEDALAAIERARERDPLSPLVNSTVAWVLYYARRYDLAIEEAKKTLELAPGYVDSRLVLGLAFQQKSMFAEARSEHLAASEMSGGSPLVLGVLGSTYALSGMIAEAQEVLQRLATMPQDVYVAPFSFAIVYSGLRDTEHAFEWLTRAATARDGLVRYIKVFPIFDGLRGDPRFQELLELVGLERGPAPERGACIR